MEKPDIYLGEKFILRANTHDAETGSATDADTAPAYRIYEEDNETPILFGSLIKFDDANTTGFYTKLIDCIADNGFAHNKVYTVYISAQVNSKPGTISSTFRVLSKPTTLSEMAAAIWSYSARTLTQTTAQVISAMTGSGIVIRRGDTFSWSLTGLGSLTGYVAIDFTVKKDRSLSDEAAIIRIRKNATGTEDGLLRLNGATALTPSSGWLVIDNEALGNITINLKSTITDDLAPLVGLCYDVQVIKPDYNVRTATENTLEIEADVTRLIS